MIRLSILISTIESRVHLLERLLDAMQPQLFINGEQVAKICVLSDDAPDPKDINIKTLTEEEKASYQTTGAKRNRLERDCDTEYLCHFDDDDMPSDDYVSSLFEGIKKGVDVITFKGDMRNLSTKASNEFHFHIRDEKGRPYPYDDFKGINGKKVYRRPPGHLCAMKTAIALQVPFPEINHGEDFGKCLRMQEMGLLQTEHFVDRTLYYYLYTPNK